MYNFVLFFVAFEWDFFGQLDGLLTHLGYRKDQIFLRWAFFFLFFCWYCIVVAIVVNVGRFCQHYFFVVLLPI